MYGAMDAELSSFDKLEYLGGCNVDEVDFVNIDSAVSSCDSILSSIADFTGDLCPDDEDYEEKNPAYPRSRNERHKLVERQRREKTKQLLKEIQAVIPGVSDSKQTPNINAVLEETLEYLQSENQAKRQKECKEVLAMKVRDVVDLKKKSSMVSPFDDTSCRRYLYAFDYAPMGLVISSIDGRVLGANKSFLRWFRFENGMDGSTIFSLTSPPHLAQTLKVLQFRSLVPLPLLTGLPLYFLPCRQHLNLSLATRL